jgi:hypothetical protein
VRRREREFRETETPIWRTRFDEDIWIWGTGEGPGTVGRRRARRLLSSEF